MLVKAKCISPAWDSISSTRYEPGAGPLPDGLYEIERDGPLAFLRLGNDYCFAFDRNAGPDDKPHDYTCKKDGCGRKFKTLAELGTHTNADHNVPDYVDDTPIEVVLKDLTASTCSICGKVCKNKNGLRLHSEAHKEKSQDAVTEAA